MKVVIIEPSNLSHRIRGTGFYTSNLSSSLKKYFPKDEFLLSKNVSKSADLVHYPFFEPFFLSLPLKKTKKTVVTVHDLTPIVFKDKFPSGLKGKLKWGIQKVSLKKSDAIITDSQNSKKDIVKIVDIDEEKVHVVYLAAGDHFNSTISENKLKEVREKFSLPNDFLLYVGDVTWNKNLPNLIRAVNNTKHYLVIAGEVFQKRDFDQKNLWNQDLLLAQELAAKNGKILSLGFVDSDDLPSLYKLATVFVMPSLYEGFGLPVLEAMASGCPVITTKEGSLIEVAGSAAYFVDPRNERSIEEGIEKMMSDEKLRESLVKKGKIQSRKFSWQKTAEQTQRVYESIL